MPQNLSPKWDELPRISAPAMPMLEDTQQVRREAKRPVKESPQLAGPKGEESHYTQIANEICAIHCKDTMNFDPYTLQQQLKELSENFPYKHNQVPVPSYRESPDVGPEVPFKKKVHSNATNRIALQQVCDGDLMDGLFTSIPDQRIRFDKGGNPWDKKDFQSRESYHENRSSGYPDKPAQSHAGYRDAPGGDDPRGSDSSEDTTHPIVCPIVRADQNVPRPWMSYLSLSLRQLTNEESGSPVTSKEVRQ